MSALYHGREYVVCSQIYTEWQKFHTAAGSDGSDKYHLWDPNGRNRTWLLDKLTLPAAWQTTKDEKGGLCLKKDKDPYLNNLRQGSFA